MTPEKLIKRAKLNQAQLEADRYEKKRQEANITEINDVPDEQLTAFWCNKCKKDFECMGNKTIQTDWSNGDVIGFFVGYCPKGHRAIKRITDKTNDPYYNQSLKVRIDRIEQKDDMLTPDDFGFRTLYGNPFDV